MGCEEFSFNEVSYRPLYTLKRIRRDRLVEDAQKNDMLAAAKLAAGVAAFAKDDLHALGLDALFELDGDFNINARR